MGAAEDEGVGVQACGIRSCGEFVEVDADDLGGDGVAGPSFFNEGDEQRAGLLKRAQALGLAGGGVGVALDGGIGGDDEHVSSFWMRRGRRSAPGSMTPRTGTGTASWMASRARALAVLQAMTRNSAPCSRTRNCALSTA